VCKKKIKEEKENKRKNLIDIMIQSTTKACLLLENSFNLFMEQEKNLT
jgi:hypothetical protein